MFAVTDVTKKNSSAGQGIAMRAELAGGSWTHILIPDPSGTVDGYILRDYINIQQPDDP